jgi:2-dehydro-3-deoxygalactonokinase
MSAQTPTDAVAVIDGGTSRTRLRLWDGTGIAWEASRQIGVKDAGLLGKTVLESAVVELVAGARKYHAFDRIVAFGMITSNLGLCEIPHLKAPVSYSQLGRAIAVRNVPAVGAVHFIPGIKTEGTAAVLAEIASFDMMRGEETEVFGMRRDLTLEGPANFFHVGSHHKLICTNDDGILGSRTTLSGELLAATLKNTILSTSTAPLESLTEVDETWWNAGLQTTLVNGFARAAFCVRLADQILHATREEATAFFLGASAGLDLPMLSGSLPLFLYGHLTVTKPLCRYLEGKGIAARLVDPAVTKLAAVRGAAALLQSFGRGLPVT